MEEGRPLDIFNSMLGEGEEKYQFSCDRNSAASCMEPISQAITKPRPKERVDLETRVEQRKA